MAHVLRKSSCAVGQPPGHEELAVACDLNAGSAYWTHGLFDDFFYLPTFDVSLDRDEMGHCYMSTYVGSTYTISSSM